MTVIPILDTEHYPLPRADELFAVLAGVKKFSRLDLNRAYQQLELDETSKGYLRLNTHQGLYAVNRLPLGIASGPAIFQRTMDNILKGLKGVTCYIDDIMLTGKTDEEHMRNLEFVLQRLSENGVKVSE